MKWKKRLTILILIALILNGLVVSTSPSFGDTYVEHITIEVRTSRDVGIEDTATGDVDVFLQEVEGSEYEDIQSNWKESLQKWQVSESYNNLLFNPAYNKTYDIPVTKVSGDWQFNPFGDRQIRFAVNFLMNRSHIVEEFYGGYANERYCAIGQENPGYEEYFAPVIEELGLTPTGDFEQGYNMIQERMEHWANNETLEEVTNKTPELQNPNNTANPSNLWTYDGEPIEILCYNRIEDERLQTGHYFTDQMDRCGFDTDDRDSDKINPTSVVFYSDPADQEFHAYTGGWLEDSAKKYQHITLNQMYCGWYTWMPGFAGWGGSWSYYGPEELEEKGKDLVRGSLEDKKTYWQYMQDVCRMGVQESVRIFLNTDYNYIPSNKNQVSNTVTDRISGWSDVFSIRTMKTSDVNGDVKIAPYAPNGIIFMDNWNRIDGADNEFIETQQRMVYDPSVTTHPYAGTPIALRANFTVEKDYRWENDILIENMQVPSSAVTYDAINDTWKEVGNGKRCAVAVTYDWKENKDGFLGTFHNGQEFTERNILAWYAFSKELTHDDGEGYYNREWSYSKKSLFNDIDGIEWGENDGTFTIYGNYSYPINELIAEYYSITPYKPWQINEAARIMVNAGDESNLRSGAPHEGENFSWSEEYKNNWVHFLSEKQCNDFIYVMEQMQNNNWIPDYLKAENGCPIPIEPSNSNEQIDKIINFYNKYNHLFISQGPFRIIQFDDSNQTMELHRWYQEDGYPFSKDHWKDKHEVLSLELYKANMPFVINEGDAFTVEVEAGIRQDYPHKRLYDADEGNVTFELWDSEEKIGEVEGTYVEPGIFRIDVPGEMTQGLDGTYNVKIKGTVEGDITPDMISKTLIVYSGDVQINNLNVDPIEGGSPLNITITASITNTAGTSNSVDIRIDGELRKTLNVEAEDSFTYVDIFTLKEIGEHTIQVGGQSIIVTVTEEEPDVTVRDFEVNPSSGEQPLEVTITSELKNTGESDKEVEVKADGEVINTYTVESGGTVPVEETVTLSEVGDYIVEVGNSKELISVEESTSEGDGSTDDIDEDEGLLPGFPLVILVLSAIVAVLVYRRKE